MPLPDYPIVTDRLRLRPFTDDDLDALHAIQSRPDVARYLYWPPRTRDECVAALKTRMNNDTLAAEGDALSLAVDLIDDDQTTMVGDMVLFWRSEAHQQGELGYVMHPDFAGRGYTAEAARAMLRIGFEGFGLHRITAQCDTRNTASARVMVKLGMRREAHFVENEFVKDEWTDEYVYAIRRADWAARNANRDLSS